MGILGVILGILAMVCADLATFLFGTVGGVVAGVLGVAAILLGILKRKRDSKGGIAAIIIGVLAVIIMIGLTGTWSKLFTDLHDKAVEYKPDGLWAQATEDVNGGFLGIMRKVPGDEASLNAFLDEMNELNELSGAQAQAQ